ncbi:MAG: hypothetical protein ABI614_25065 [Planctomycetota bacterium]
MTGPLNYQPNAAAMIIGVGLMGHRKASQASWKVQAEAVKQARTWAFTRSSY